MNDILIIGGGGHAKVVAALLKKHEDWNPIGYTNPEDNGPLLGLPYLGTDEVILSLISDKTLKHAAIGIGQVGPTEHRAGVIRKIQAMRLTFPSLCSSNSTISEDVEIGVGTIIMDGAVIQPGVRIGAYCVINTRAIIDHDCQIGDWVHIAPGAILSGEIKISNDVFIGAGATIIQGLSVTSNSIIGAGSVVIRHVREPGIYAGVPSTIIKVDRVE